MSTKVSFPNSTINSSHAGPISIQNLVVGPIEINKVTLTNFNGNFKYQSGKMKNLRLRMKIYPYADWWIKVSVDLGDFFGEITIVDEKGHVDLGSIDTGWSNLGDMDISAGDMNLLVKEASFGPFKLTPSAIEGTKIRAVDVNSIQMVNTKVPTGLPSMFGADIEMPNMMKPVNASVQETKMATFSSTGIALPGMSFSNIQALNVKMDEAQSGKLYAKTKSNPINLGGVDLLGFAGVTIGVVIETEMSADSLNFNDLSGNVTTDNAFTSGFTMNMDMRGIIMCYLKLMGYSIPTIAIEG